MIKRTCYEIANELSMGFTILLFLVGGYFIGKNMVVDPYGMAKIFGGWLWIVYGIIFLALFGYAADLIWNFWTIDERLEGNTKTNKKRG